MLFAWAIHGAYFHLHFTSCSTAWGAGSLVDLSMVVATGLPQTTHAMLDWEQWDIVQCHTASIWLQHSCFFSSSVLMLPLVEGSFSSVYYRLLNKNQLFSFTDLIFFPGTYSWHISLQCINFSFFAYLLFKGWWILQLFGHQISSVLSTKMR